jgi:hypothetical protein
MKKRFISTVLNHFEKERKTPSLLISKNFLFDILSMQVFNEL